MNKNIKNIGWSLLLVSGLVASCTTDLDINTDPNNPTLTTAQPNLVLPSALQSTSNIYNRPAGNATFQFAAVWLGQAGFSGNFFISQDANTYNINTNFAEGAWTAFYDNAADYQLIEDLSKTQRKPFFQGIGKIMKSLNYQSAVDLYNNVPYSEAQKGAVTPTPKYDNGREVYEKTFDDIEAGSALIGTAVSTATAAEDVMFQGDKAKWAAFANTLRLRTLLRQSERTDRAAYITSKLPSLQTATFVTADVAINPGYLNSDGKQNGFWRSCHTPTGTYNQDFLRPGKYIIDFMKANNDPRLGRYAKPNGSGGFVGTQLGATNPPNGGNSGSSEFGLGLLQGPTQNSVLMTAAESYFLQAEAVVRGWIPGDAKALFTSGVAASFSYMGAGSPTAYTSQVGNKQANWDATTSNAEKIALIIRQKYLALAMINSLESYNDYRRLGLPSDIVISPIAGSNRVPKRLLYPAREYSVNPTNATAQGTVNAQTDKIWWMQ